MGEEGQQRLIAEHRAERGSARPEDIAAMVMFFASEVAGWITGQVIERGRRQDER